MLDLIVLVNLWVYIGISSFHTFFFIVLHDVFHVSLFCEYCKGVDSHMVVQSIIIDGEPDWEIDVTLHHYIVGGITKYLISFVGFNIRKAIWLTADALSNALDVLYNY